MSVTVPPSRAWSVEERLARIDQRLEVLIDEFQDAASAWFDKKGDRELAWASAYLTADGVHSARKAAADKAAYPIGREEEAAWEGKRAVLKALETQAMINAALLRAGRSVGA